MVNQSSKHSDTEVGSTSKTNETCQQPKAYFVACFQLCVLETVRIKMRRCPEERDGVTKDSIVGFLEKQDYVSGDIDSQVESALNELTAGNVLQISEDGAYRIVFRTVPTKALGDESEKDRSSGSLGRKRPASDTSVIYVGENQTIPVERVVKAGRRRGMLKKSPRP